MSKRIRILVLAANPKDTSPLRLDEEVREIQSGIQRSALRGRFEVIQQWAVRPRDIRRALLDHSPDIVHFCGHGAGAEGLVFENDHGESAFVATGALAELFELCSDSLRCVLLNACYSQVQAQAIASHVSCVVGMSQAFGDRAAIEFAVGFYDALAAGKSVEVAFRFGCNAIQLEGLHEKSTPVLLKREEEVGAATTVNKRPSRVSRSVPCTPRSAALLAIHDYTGIVSQGWSVDSIISRLLRMDYDTISGLDIAAAGNLGQWRPVVVNNPDGFAFILNEEKEVVGYWHFVTLQDDLFAKAMAGEMEDEEITVDHMRFLCMPGIYDIYFVIMAVDPRYRGYRANRLLFDAFLDRLDQLSRAGIFVRSIAANAFTLEGVGLCRSVGMQLLRPHMRRGEIFSLSMEQAAPLLRSRPALLDRTTKAIKEMA